MSAPERSGGGRGGLQELVGGVRTKLVGGALLAGGLWFLVLLALVLGGAWVLSGPDGWSSGSLVPLLLDAVLVGGAAAGAVALARHLRARITDASIADRLDGIGGFGRGTARGALELSRAVPPGVSAAMARRSERSVLEALPGDSGRLTGAPGERFHRWSRRAAAVLAVALPALALLAVSDSARTASAWSGLLRPAGVVAEEPLPPLRVEPAEGALPRGSDLEVVVRAPGRERVRLDWQFDGEPERTGEAAVDRDGARFELGPLEAPVEYRAVAPDGARSERIRIVPEDPLLVTDLRLDVFFPRHTGESPRHFQREAPPLELPEGSMVRISGRANRELGEARLRAVGGEAPEEEGGGPELGLEVADDRFAGEWRPRRSGRYEWVLRAADGSEAPTAPPPLEVTLVPDSLPRIELTFPGRDTVLPLDRRQPLVIRAEDDYGIRSLELVAYRASADDPEPVVRELEVEGHRAAAARPVLDLSEWELLPGDSVLYRARVTDNAPDPGTAETPEYVLRVPRRNRASRDVEERLRTTAEGVDSLAEAADRAAQEARELERRGLGERDQEPPDRDRSRRGRSGASRGGAGGESVSFEAREEARRAVEQQQELVERLDSLGSDLDEIRRALDEAGLSDPDLRRDLEELRSLAERVAPDEMRERLDEATDRLDEMNRQEMEEALERLARDQEEFRDRIERSLDRFRRAAAEQEFRSTAREARELAEQQSGLADALESGRDREQRTRQQEELAGRAEDLEERMEKLEESLERMGEKEARRGVERARSGSEDASRSMERAARMSRQQRSEEAGQEARSAAERLRESAEGLDRARDEMAEQRQEQVRESFERGAAEARALARRQGELQERMRGARGEDRSELRGDEAAVAEGLRALASNLAEPSMLDPERGEEVSEAVDEAMESVERALEALEQEGGGSPSPSAASMEAAESLNRLARAADRAAAGEGGSEGRASEGAGTQEQLQGLARRQQGLAEQSGALQPMDLGRESLQGRLREMAGGQESVADRLSELAGDPAAREEALGDLEGMAEEADELARRLEDGRLDPETVRRQERLFHRLLDAGRSLETDERSDQREARTADPVRAPEVEPLTVEERGGERYELPESELLRSLPPAQRALIVRYFERLNRSGEDGPGRDGGDG